MSGYTKQDRIRNDEVIREKTRIAPIVENMVNSRLLDGLNMCGEDSLATIRRADHMKNKLMTQSISK